MISGYEPPALPKTHFLDNRIFTDETIFAQEKEEIYQRVWLFVCHESELAAQGDFRTVSVAGKPLILVRAPDGIIRAFYNVCRHRAAPVVR